MVQERYVVLVLCGFTLYPRPSAALPFPLERE